MEIPPGGNAVTFMPVPGITPVGMRVLGILFGLIFLWSTTEIIWPSLLGMIVLGLSGYFDTINQTITAGFGNPVIWQIVMMMFFVSVLNAVGISEYIVYKIIGMKMARGRPILLVTLLIFAFYLVSALANVFAALFLGWAIIGKIADVAGYKRTDKPIILLMVFVTGISEMGSAAFPLKSWQLGIWNAFSAATGTTPDFLLYMLVAAIIGFVISLVLTISMRAVFRADLSKLKALDMSALKGGVNEKLSLIQKACLILFLVMIVAVIVASLLPPTTPLKLVVQLGTTGFFTLSVIGLYLLRMKNKPMFEMDAMIRKEFRWEPVLIVAVILPLADSLTSDKTGIVTVLGSIVYPMLSGSSTFLVIGAIVFLAVLFTNVGNDIVVAFMFIPFVLSISAQAGISVPLLAAIILISSCVGITLPNSSTIAALAYGNEYLKAKHMIVYGGYISVIYIVVATIVFYFINVALML